MMKRSTSIAFFTVLTCALLFAGCKKNEPNKVVDPESKAEFTFPLTGMKTSDEAAVESRPVAVVINNDPKARPQTGLNEADIVYEVLTEGNITRFLAIFQSEKPENIGPVRSARPYFINLAKGYDAFFVAHGYSPEAKAMLESGTIDHINGISYDGSLFQRVSFRKAPHNSYITYENIAKGAEQNNYTLDKAVEPLTFLEEDDVNDIQGDEAANVTVQYSNRYSVTYNYDLSANEYTRFIGQEQTVDYDTNEPLSVANILIIEMNHQVLDDVGRRSVDISSGGDAILLQNGIARHIQWANENGRIVPKTTEGEVGFIPGRTWVHIVPTSPGLQQTVKLSETE